MSADIPFAAIQAAGDLPDFQVIPVTQGIDYFLVRRKADDGIFDLKTNAALDGDLLRRGKR